MFGFSDNTWYHFPPSLYTTLLRQQYSPESWPPTNLTWSPLAVTTNGTPIGLQCDAICVSHFPVHCGQKQLKEADDVLQAEFHLIPFAQISPNSTTNWGLRRDAVNPDLPPLLQAAYLKYWVTMAFEYNNNNQYLLPHTKAYRKHFKVQSQIFL